MSPDASNRGLPLRRVRTFLVIASSAVAPAPDVPGSAGDPPAGEALRALSLFGLLTAILAVFVIAVAVITARRRSRLRRELSSAKATPLPDAWAESARRLTLAPSEVRPAGDGPPPRDDRDPPPHDDDPPSDPRGRWRPR